MMPPCVAFAPNSTHQPLAIDLPPPLPRLQEDMHAVPKREHHPTRPPVTIDTANPRRRHLRIYVETSLVNAWL